MGLFCHTSGKDEDKDAEMIAPQGKVRKTAGEEEEAEHWQEDEASRSAPGVHAYACAWCLKSFRTLQARCGHMGRCRQRRSALSGWEERRSTLAKETYLGGKRGLRKERKLAARPARLRAKGKMKLLLRHNVPVVPIENTNVLPCKYFVLELRHNVPVAPLENTNVLPCETFCP